MRALFLLSAVVVTGCATALAPAPARSPVDPTVYHDFRVVPRAPDVALYPAVAEHVWVPVPGDRVIISVKVFNHPPPPRPAFAPPPVAPAASPVSHAAPAPARAPHVYTAQISFAFDRHVLDAKARQEIEQLIQRVGQSFGSSEIVVEGYTDSVGSEAYNLKLSALRAAVVRDFLVAKGASRSLVSVSGKGESSPAASNSTEQGRAQNRRSTVQVTSD